MKIIFKNIEILENIEKKKKLKNMTIVKVRNDKFFEEYEDFEKHQDF
jgi:hypothetical protein